MLVAVNGKEERALHFQVEWESGSTESTYSWEPIIRLFRDVPEMVK